MQQMPRQGNCSGLFSTQSRDIWIQYKRLQIVELFAAIIYHLKEVVSLGTAKVNVGTQKMIEVRHVAASLLN